MKDGVSHTDLRPSVAIIGAGISGLACARALEGVAKTVLFDKSRGVGGRMSTRYAGAYEFDHGAQYFTVRDPAFRAEVEAAEADGVLTRWPSRALYLTDDGLERDRGGDRWVGTPRMNAFPKWLAEGRNIELGQRVSAIRAEAGYTLHFEDGSTRAGFSAVAVAVPAPQAAAILPDTFAHLDAVRSARMDVCFALMLGLDRDPGFGFDTLRAKGLPVDWIAVNSHKPGRPDTPATLMVHAEADWSNAHAEADRDAVLRTLRQTASDLLFTDLRQAPHQTLHRWLYSSVAHPAGEPCLWDETLRIGACGDWCPGGRVEGAWQSGVALAARIADTLR